MSIVSEEEQPLFSNNPISVYSKSSSDDPFTFRANQMSKKRVRRGEHSPAYSVLTENNLLITAFRKERFSDVFVEEDLVPNSSLAQNFAKRWRWGVYFTPGCGLFIYRLFNKEIIVPPGHISCFTDEDNNYIFAKPGIHNIQDPFLNQVSSPIAINGAENQRNVIEHGNRTVLTVPQGMLGIATDMGQLILLPPGLHSWKSETLRFDKMHRLDDSPTLKIGPYTIVTVDDGYVAVTMNNGKQVLLEGGKTHLLTHQKWRFERFMNMKLQADDICDFKATTADKIIVSLDATVTWRIAIAEKAAMIVTESGNRSESDISLDTSISDDMGSLNKLRNNVLSQSMSGLAYIISSVHYSDYFLRMQSSLSPNEAGNTPDRLGKTAESDFITTFFDEGRSNDLLEKVNGGIEEFGVEVLQVSIIAINISEKENSKSAFALGAISSAESLHIQARAIETAKATKIEAEAKAAARSIQAKSEAESSIIKAKADAAAGIKRSEGEKLAELIRAEGSKEAAKILATCELAQTLETIKVSASAIKNSDKFFFGKEPHYISNVLKDSTHL